MTMDEYDLLVIGAGPAGMMLSYQLVTSGKRVCLVELGRIHTTRKCSVDQRGICSGCGGRCNVISGFGGCIHNGDGAKISLFPTGKRLLEKIGLHRGAYYTDKLIETLTLLAGKPLEFISTDHCEYPHTRKQLITLLERQEIDLVDYPVAILNEESLIKVITSLHETLTPKVDIRLNSEVTHFNIDTDGFTVDGSSAKTQRKCLLSKKLRQNSGCLV